MSAIKRSELTTIRESLRFLQLVVAEADAELRYRWIDNPHPDFDANAVIGKRDDDLLPAAEAQEIMALKRQVLVEGVPIKKLVGFRRSDGWRAYSIGAYPVRNAAGQVDGVLTVGFDASGVLFGLIPICAGCHRIRDERGDWHRLEDFLSARTKSSFTHSVCPVCAPRLFPGIEP